MRPTIAAPALALATAASLAVTLPAAAQDCAQGMRAFEHAAGTACIPVAPQRIVSVRGEQFTAPLWELGAPLVGSAGRTDDGKNGGAPYPRGAFDLFNLTFDGSDLTWIGSPNDPDFESIVALEPDLILIPDWQEDLLEQFELIAPTVAIGIHSNPMLERYRLIADAAGLLDRYEAGLQRYQSRLTAARLVVADRLGDPADVSVVIAEVFNDNGGLTVYGNYGAMSQVLADLGFAEPQIATDLGVANESVSVELLPEIQADFMIGTYNLAFDQPPSQRIEEWERLFPAWDEVLHAARHNQHLLIDREPMRALSFRALEEVLAIFLSHIATRDFVPLEG
ncbi:MAG: ABC transporter substrate-binding protein [Pseudomonadota bacterium]